MDIAIAETRSQIARRIEAEIIGDRLPEPYGPQIKGKFERVAREFVRGGIDEAEFRSRLVGLQGAYLLPQIPTWPAEQTRAAEERWATAGAIMSEFPLLRLTEEVKEAVGRFVWGRIGEAELRATLEAARPAVTATTIRCPVRGS